MEEKKEITAKDLVEIIKANPDINFVANAVTPWHAIAIDASIMWLQDQGVDVRGLCLLEPHMDYGYVCDTSVFTNTVSKKYMYKYSFHPYHLIRRKYYFYRFIFGNVHKRNSDNLVYLLSPGTNVDIGSYVYELLPHKHIRYILTEEGVGTYLGTCEREIPTYNSFITFLKYLKTIHRYSMIDYVEKHHEVVNNRLFTEDEDGELILNERIVPYYRDSVYDKAKRALGEAAKFDLRDSVLLCTNAWYRDKVKDDEDYKVLLDVCNNLHAKGVKIILKPHPRDAFFAEHAKNLHAEIMEHSYPIESMCSISQPKAIIGYSSTALVTAKLFWNIPVYCLSDMLDQSKLDDLYLKETGKFKKKFHNYVCFPKRMDEILIK